MSSSTVAPVTRVWPPSTTSPLGERLAVGAGARGGRLDAQGRRARAGVRPSGLGEAFDHDDLLHLDRDGLPARPVGGGSQPGGARLALTCDSETEPGANRLRRRAIARWHPSTPPTSGGEALAAHPATGGRGERRRRTAVDERLRGCAIGSTGLLPRRVLIEDGPRPHLRAEGSCRSDHWSRSSSNCPASAAGPGRALRHRRRHRSGDRARQPGAGQAGATTSAGGFMPP